MTDLSNNKSTACSDAPFVYPRVLAWEITRRCPMKCSHCRAGAHDIPYDRELTTEECLRVISSIATSNQSPLLIWTGGEPMLRPDILDLVSAATERGIRSVMAPCGALVTSARLIALRAAGVAACSFSLDGPDAKSHDAFRGVPGAFSNVTHAMDIANSIGMPFQINTTVSKLNLDRIDEIYKKAIAFGAGRLDLFFLVPVGRGAAIRDQALSKEETNEILRWAFAKTKAGPLPIKETCCPSAPALWEKCGGEETCGRRPCGCLGGRGFAFLSHTGILQTCGFVENPCGDIRKFNFDLAALTANAMNPLGKSDTCRGKGTLT